MEEELYKVNMIVHELSCLVPEQVISHQPLNPQLFFSSRAHALFSLPAVVLLVLAAPRRTSCASSRGSPAPPARAISVPSNVTSRYENFLDQILPRRTSNSQCKMKEEYIYYIKTHLWLMIALVFVP